MKYYIRDHTKPNDREKYHVYNYGPSELEAFIKTQQNVIDYHKEQKHKELYQIPTVIDDFADDTNLYESHNYLNYILEVAII